MKENNKVTAQRSIVDVANELGIAKNAVQYCLDNEAGMVDMHGLAYWAGVVERLRKEIKTMI